MNNAEMVKELERLKAENAKLKEARVPSVSFKVSQKGACSMYGLGRFPVTLYLTQWERLLDHAEQIRAFLADNADKLAKKE